MKLSNSKVATLVRPADKDDVVIWDDELPGFGIRLRGDAKTYLAQYRVGPQQRRESLGDVRKVKLEDARKAARQRFAKAQLGIDPAAERAHAKARATSARLTLGAVLDRYLEAKEASLRPNTYEAAKRYATIHWTPLRDRAIDDVKRIDVAARLQELIKSRGRTAAARARAHLAAAFTWAMREGLVENNVVVGTNDPGAGIKSRARVLSEAELAVIWKVSGDDDFARILKLLMMTGCRRQEIGDLKWHEVDFDRGTMTIPGTRTKNHRALTLTLPAIAIELLRSVPRREGRDNVFGVGVEGFNGWSYAVALLNARITAVEGKALLRWTLHDVRRSVATGMAEIGIQPHVIEAVLNHVGHRAGVAGIYNRASYSREIAAALTQWTEHLGTIVDGHERKVLPLRTR